jgi:uncharacterized protein (DUF1330 family)
MAAAKEAAEMTGLLNLEEWSGSHEIPCPCPQLKEEKMPAYLIGHIAVKDPTQWQTYVAGVKESLAPFKAEIVFRGECNSVLAGRHPYQQAVVIRFVDQEELQGWFHSPSYQALIPIRDRAAEVVIVSFDA